MYGKWLPEWAESVAGQDVKPVQVVVMDAGCDDHTPVLDAMAILGKAGIPSKLKRITYTSLGAARNAAVERTNTEWVIHLDADDMLLPHAISDIAQLAPKADVVSLGALHNREPVVFPDISREAILNRTFGTFSCAAFKRRYWKQRPWHTHNDWVDSTFWVGLAHLGATFVGTGRVGFIYRQHPDSITHKLTPEQKQQAVQQWREACEAWTLT